MDYRDVTETNFDAISSIGLTEHIGVRNYNSYFGFLRDHLKVGGRLLNHYITRPHNKTMPKAWPDRPTEMLRRRVSDRLQVTGQRRTTDGSSVAPFVSNNRRAVAARCPRS